MWALSMVNSWGKFPATGFVRGTTTDLGAYDQCIDIEPNPLIGTSQYCLIDFRPALPPMPRDLNLFHKFDLIGLNISDNNIFRHIETNAPFLYYISWRIGICLPSMCTLSDVRSMAHKFANEWHIIDKKVHCETKQEYSVNALNSVQWLAIFVLSVFLLSALVSTILDVFSIEVKRLDTVINAFSIRKNLNKIIKTETDSKQLLCLHGIRVLSISWIIMGHSMLWTNPHAYSRYFDSKKHLKALELQPILNAAYAVDTFFVISGLLATYMTFSVTKGLKEQFSTIGFLTARYLRLTPQFAVFILFTFLLPLISSGPLWAETVEPIVDKCYKNWWISLLYLQNYINVREACQLHTWYLSCDMQFYIMSVIIIIAFFNRKTIALKLTVLLMSAFAIITFCITYVNRYPPAIINTQRDNIFEEFVDVLWRKPYSHAPCFFVGLALGYNLANDYLPKISKPKVLLYWSLTLFGFIAITFDSYPSIYGEPYSPLYSALVYTLCRILWALCMLWLIMGCVCGYGGVVNRLLSWKAFIPLSRLTYAVFLTHVWWLWTFMGTVREQIDVSRYSMTFHTLSHWMGSYLLGFLFALLIEYPLLALQKNFVNNLFNPKK